MPESAPVTDEDLDVIEARAAAATPGPWRSTWEDDNRPPLVDSCDDEIVVEAVGRTGGERLVVGTMYYDGRWPACTEPNAAFIAAAREDVPRLVAAVRAGAERELRLLRLLGIVARLAAALVPFKELGDSLLDADVPDDLAVSCAHPAGCETIYAGHLRQAERALQDVEREVP